MGRHERLHQHLAHVQRSMGDMGGPNANPMVEQQYNSLVTQKLAAEIVILVSSCQLWHCYVATFPGSLVAVGRAGKWTCCARTCWCPPIASCDGAMTKTTLSRNAGLLSSSNPLLLMNMMLDIRILMSCMIPCCLWYERGRGLRSSSLERRGFQ